MWKNLIIVGLVIILLWIIISPTKTVVQNNKQIDSLENVISILENKKDSYNIRKYMENNKITLRADTKESVDENVKIVKRTNTAGVFKNNIRIGTIREKSGKWRMT